MSDEVPFTIIQRDEVDLLAMLRTLREAQVRAVEITETGLEPEYQEQRDRQADERATRALGDIAARGCARFEGGADVRSEYRHAKERRYSFYAMHPDTAEQMMKAVEFLIERFGPRFEAPMRPQRHAPQTKRNAASES